VAGRAVSPSGHGRALEDGVVEAPVLAPDHGNIGHAQGRRRTDAVDDLLRQLTRCALGGVVREVGLNLRQLLRRQADRLAEVVMSAGQIQLLRPGGKKRRLQGEVTGAADLLVGRVVHRGHGALRVLFPVRALTVAALLLLVAVGDGSPSDPCHHRCRHRECNDTAPITHARPPEPKGRFAVILALVDDGAPAELSTRL